ncbi:8942_t:CDS:2 [Diversispora eburnea]|uniref:8942_t:CDS:1 n=1 Tax=Diversispora eburnea TaxID=1213867 RepID=A0A9N9BTT9_9GLOM|nr:8942_t:CDS:2 [Diversispora eburnea]
MHGAIKCVNPLCPAKKIKYTTQGRDVNANIDLSGASIILAANEFLTVMTPDLVPTTSFEMNEYKSEVTPKDTAKT